jgi:serine/threonine-protein kinase
VEDSPTNEEAKAQHEADLAAKERASSLIGRVISERYRIAELVAMGGMGAVYRAEHLLLKKRIAIKILHPDIENLPELVSRFEREAIAGAHIQHPNVAAATDFGKLEDGSFFLVLEYVRGTTLHQAIKKGCIEPRRAVHIARQIASALGAAHAMGIVHRDVKPRNVMLIEGRGDLAKLIDFGLAKVSMERLADSLRSPMSGAAPRSHVNSGADSHSQPHEGDRLTGVGVIFGTIAYLAPEAALGMDSVDGRADLYALGLILYEMLAGKHPFVGTDAVELFKQQRYAIPPPLCERAPGVNVPSALEAVVMRLLAKDPAARYQTAKELVDALDASIEELPLPEGPSDAAKEMDASEAKPASSKAKSAPERASARLSKGRGGAQTTHRSPPTLRSYMAKKRRTSYLPGALAAVVAVVGLLVFARHRLSQRTLRATEANSASTSAPLVAASGAAEVSSAGEAPGVREAADAKEASDAVAKGAPPPEGSAPLPPATAEDRIPEKLERIDAAGLRVIVIRATRAQLWPTAEEALLALAVRDPASFGRPDVIAATRELVVGLERSGSAAKVFDVLENRLGAAGLDLLYEVVESKGGSRAATRAFELLHKDAVRARSSAALRIACDLRDASCVDMLKLLDRAVQDGDGRALTVLQTFGVACFNRNRDVDQAITDLRAKLKR